MKADELGLDHPKLMLDFATGDVSVSYPSKTDATAVNAGVAA